MPTPCFLIEPAGHAVVTLRRFTWCEGHDGTAPPCVDGHIAHDATADTELTARKRHHPTEGWEYEGWQMRRRIPKSDPRWPTQCSRCGYRFSDGDEWQQHADLAYRRVDNGEVARREAFGPGAMFDARWAPDAWVGADGLHLTVVLPCGHNWIIDAPATGGGHWTRTGTPPLVSVSPSIWCKAAPEYHGFLGSSGQPPGVLSDHLG